MKQLRKQDIPEKKYSNAFLGFGPEDSCGRADIQNTPFPMSSL